MSELGVRDRRERVKFHLVFDLAHADLLVGGSRSARALPFRDLSPLEELSSLHPCEGPV